MQLFEFYVCVWEACRVCPTTTTRWWATYPTSLVPRSPAQSTGRAPVIALLVPIGAIALKWSSVNWARLEPRKPGRGPENWPCTLSD